MLANTGSIVHDRGMMYKAVDHSVLLCGSESSVGMGGMLKVLERFHHRASRWITGMTETHGVGREW